MRWSLLLAVLAAPLIVPVATPGTAHACSCAYAPDDPRILEHVARAKGVFTGTATAQRADGDTAYYEFDVREVFAGEIGASTVVATSTHSDACGTGYTVGAEYLVFASTSRSHGAPWSDGLCSATTQSTNTRTREAAIEIYGPPSSARLRTAPSRLGRRRHPVGMVGNQPRRHRAHSGTRSRMDTPTATTAHATIAR